MIKVKKVNNPQLYGLYLLSKEELQKDTSFNVTQNVSERFLYHSTTIENAEVIAKENINWRLTKRKRFGAGACFSPTPNYAYMYSSVPKFSNAGKYI